MSRAARLARGAAKRCARCGAGGLFTSRFEMADACPACGLEFEREEGYWVGAMIVNIVVTELVFGAVLVGGMLASWPDVPWTQLLIAGVVLNVAVPVLFYPRSKTLWVGIDRFFTDPPDA